ncbi:peptidase inhibitor family I36 protein [Streptomyces sp. NPDC056160]|uniref:peptidase inhibitor family I36 protein n=1 Tax=Streptomyces sp. NPDC056160 TaxID=3345731 RepID=UPI0035D71BB8
MTWPGCTGVSHASAPSEPPRRPWASGSRGRRSRTSSTSGSVRGTGPAAAGSPPTCVSGRTTTTRDTAWRWWDPASAWRTSSRKGSPSWTNKISSFVNNTYGNYCLYEKEGYGGAVMKMGPREHWASLPDWINDKGSSMKPC